MSEPRQVDHARESEEEEPRGVDRWIMPYLTDSMLWPVTIVIVVHAVAFIAPAILFGLRDRSLSAMAATALLLVMSFQGIRWEARRGGKLGPISWLILVTWAASVGAAYFVHVKGFM